MDDSPETPARKTWFREAKEKRESRRKEKGSKPVSPVESPVRSAPTSPKLKHASDPGNDNRALSPRKKSPMPGGPKGRGARVSTSDPGLPTVQTQRSRQLQEKFDDFLPPGAGGKISVEKTLLGIICNEAQYAQLEAYLDARFMGEGLRALVAIVEYEGEPTLDRGKAIYDRFVQESETGECVTLALDVQQAIRDSLEMEKLPSFYEMKLDILMSLSLTLVEFLDNYQIPTVEDCFKEESWYDRVLEFSKSCYMDETVEFLFFLEQYAKVQTPELLKPLGMHIVQKFLVPGAPRELNVSSKVKKTVDVILAHPDDWSKDTFEVAKADQMKLFVFDVYPRFIAHLSAQ